MLSLSFSLLACLLIPHPVYAQSGIKVQANEAILQYPDGIKFHLDTTSSTEIETVILIYGTDGRTCQTSSARQPLEFDPDTKI